jgi:hypothetical protein
MTDTLLDSDFDLAFANGDFANGDSDRQHQQLLLLTGAGEWRENPTIGVGLADFLDSEDRVAQVEARIKRQFEADGMTVELVSITNGNIQIDGKYSKS